MTCARGEMFGPGNPQLPAPPMLMMDRVTEISADGGPAGKGHVVGKPVGDPWQMPGLSLVQNPDVLWSHDFAHIGDHPDFTTMPQLVDELAIHAP